MAVYKVLTRALEEVMGLVWGVYQSDLDNYVHENPYMLKVT